MRDLPEARDKIRPLDIFEIKCIDIISSIVDTAFVTDPAKEIDKPEQNVRVVVMREVSWL